jgi:hypothetical protein
MPYLGTALSVHEKEFVGEFLERTRVAGKVSRPSQENGWNSMFDSP